VHFHVYFPSADEADEARFLCLLPRHQSPRQTRAKTPIFGKSADQRTIRRFFENQCFSRVLRGDDGDTIDTDRCVKRPEKLPSGWNLELRLAAGSRRAPPAKEPSNARCPPYCCVFSCC